MIFVTVGTHNQGFERLIKKMDEIAGRIDEEIIMQIGYTNYKPKNTKFFEFLGFHDLIEMYQKADIIITHGGAGSLLDSFKYGCGSLIVVPRLKKFGEHIDNQQLELARILEKENIIISVHHINDLEYAIKKINPHEKLNLRDGDLSHFLKKYLM